ncbi:bifunctional diguanylate cyclase/phosphodiesterase [Blastococcus sp. TF02A-26]|uniref:putative bifunctional diguanylate cyclase/phosphodiesterase n=1 Tax=Blastococcus sp. TF02A-26 TaxID=2250577 RepID=UPI000DE9BBDA|nr:bifunctional diguanylate cyclase/phosphodiesterase [Blastococcus sp. TF02A-26]RBY79495.1 hypothetical protein DQ240_22650 [Blastococcus sp. TF02A-26]
MHLGNGFLAHRLSIGSSRRLAGRGGRRWLTSPVVATPAVVGLVTGIFFTVGGLLVLMTVAATDRQFDDPEVLAGLALVAILVGLTAIGARRLIRRWLAHLIVAFGAAVITMGATQAGHSTSASLLALLYVLIAVDAALFFSWLGATLHLVGILGACTWVLCRDGGPGLGAAVLVCGTSVLVAGVVAWLVRRASDAQTDALTGLPNRRGVDRLLEDAIDAAERSGAPMTLAIADVDRFKGVNDLLGRSSADHLLAALARTWRDRLPATAALGRLGSDEFVILAPSSAADARDLLEVLREAVPPPLTCSIGGAQLDNDDPSTWLAHADQALYEAKRAGRDRVRMHAEASSARAAVQRALAQGELVVHYQPVVDLHTGALRKAEALLRWQQPGGRLLSPGEFLPIIESAGLMVEVDRFVRRTALTEVARWRGAGGPPVVTVNVTAQELLSADFADDVLPTLQERALPGSALVLEIVESSLKGEIAVGIAALERLRSHGVQVAVDDFGTGYSSLSRLTRLPLDILKIDRSFIEELHGHMSGGPVIQAILGLATALGLQVVAEGVEDCVQDEFLRSAGCPAGQGYLYGRPVPGDHLLGVTAIAPVRS